MAISLFLQENFLLPKLGRIFLKPVKLEAMLETITRNKGFQGQAESLRASSAIVGILTSPNVGADPKSSVENGQGPLFHWCCETPPGMGTPPLPQAAPRPDHLFRGEIPAFLQANSGKYNLHFRVKSLRIRKITSLGFNPPPAASSPSQGNKTLTQPSGTNTCSAPSKQRKGKK